VLWFSLTFENLCQGIVRNFTHQILLGLVFLHSHKVMHSDIKEANTLKSQTKPQH